MTVWGYWMFLSVGVKICMMASFYNNAHDPQRFSYLNLLIPARIYKKLKDVIRNSSFDGEDIPQKGVGLYEAFFAYSCFQFSQ